MLSFDITDKIIRIVRGFESSGKIKIYDAFSIDIPEKSIENGNIVDVTGLASIIGDILKSKKIKEKRKSYGSIGRLGASWGTSLV